MQAEGPQDPSLNKASKKQVIKLDKPPSQNNDQDHKTLKKRDFKPGALHEFLKEYYFKNKDEIEQMENKNRLEHRLKVHNSFVDFIANHEWDDLKDYFIPEEDQDDAGLL